MKSAVALIAGIQRNYFRIAKGVGLYNSLHFMLFHQMLSVVEKVPLSARKVLDIGCGAGIYSLLTAACRPSADIMGIDLQPSRVQMARDAASSLELPNVRFHTKDVFEWEFFQSDVYLICDLLIYLPMDCQRKLLTQVRKNIENGGTLIIKDHTDGPPWKVRSLYSEEYWGRKTRKLLNTELLQSYYDQGLFPVPISKRRNELEELGFVVRSVIVHEPSILPHVTYLACS